MSDQEVYRRFIEWLRRAWWGLPESAHLMPAVSTMYTPDEAALLTGIPFSGKDVRDLAETKEMDPDELDSKLRALARKGLVWRSPKSGTVRYKLNDSFFAFLRGDFWAENPSEAAKATARPLNKYFFDGFMDQFAQAHTKGLRAIPIDKTVQDPRVILPYEDVVKYVDSQAYCTVSICPCRHRKKLDPDSPDCEHPMETCLHFGTLGHYIVDNGLGRKITKDETYDILKMCADSGLVHALSNWQIGADTICNCCKCCCLFMEAYHVLKHDKSLDDSNYQVRINPGTCKACGLCVERCPMDALTLEDCAEASNKTGQAPMLDPDKCLGCGVCVHKCPTESLTLERRETVYDPPADAREWTQRFINDLKAATAGK